MTRKREMVEMDRVERLTALNRAKVALNKGQVRQAIQLVRAIDSGLSDRLKARLDRIEAEILELG